jgi:hypothetical protein
MTVEPIKPSDYGKSHKVIRSEEYLLNTAKDLKEEGWSREETSKYLYTMADCYATGIMVENALNEAYWQELI